MPTVVNAFTGATLYDNREVLAELYPELKPLCDELEAIITKAGCTGCARNKHTSKLLKALTDHKYDGRDLRRLIPLIGQIGVDRLRGIKAPSSRVAAIPKDYCPHCREKHLASCGILISEYLHGYTAHLPYAIAHYEEAVREGLKLGLSFEDKQLPTTLQAIWQYLHVDQDRMRLLGIANLLGELSPDSRVKEALRRIRILLHEVALPTDKPQLNPTKAELPKKIILKSHLSPGDIIVLSATVRSLKRLGGKDLQIAMDTSCGELFHHSPHLNQRIKGDPEARIINLNYTEAINNCNQRPYHFLHGYRMCLEDQLGMKVPAVGTTGEVFLSAQEQSWDEYMQRTIGDQRPYWMIMAGHKSDFTTKSWPTSYWQRVIDAMRDRIDIVQIGKKPGKADKLTHYQPRLKHTINLVGKTNLRNVAQLVHHSVGATCGITFLMHMAAAVPVLPGTGYLRRPCVVLAGGREPAHWEMYQHHIFLHNCGLYKCNRYGGCWKARTVVLPDNNKKKNEKICKDPVSHGRAKHPRCMMDVTPDMVIDAMNRYLDTMENPYG